MVVIDCGRTFATSALLRTLDTTSVGGLWRKVADMLRIRKGEQGWDLELESVKCRRKVKEQRGAKVEGG